MDERLPLGSPDAATLRTLLEKERERGRALEQEVARLKAGLARQNERILQLQRREREREDEVKQLRLLVAALQEQNALLRKEVALLHQENARLLGTPLAPAPTGAPEVKPAAREREKKVRTKRAPEQNAGRRTTEQPNRWVNHAVEACPR